MTKCKVSLCGPLERQDVSLEAAEDGVQGISVQLSIAEEAEVLEARSESLNGKRVEARLDHGLVRDESGTGQKALTLGRHSGLGNLAPRDNVGKSPLDKDDLALENLAALLGSEALEDKLNVLDCPMDMGAGKLVAVDLHRRVMDLVNVGLGGGWDGCVNPNQWSLGVR